MVGRDLADVEDEQKMLEEAIKNTRERDRRTLLLVMNKSKSKSSEKVQTDEGNKVGDLFPSASLEDYAARNRHGQDAHAHDEDKDNDDSEDEDSQDDDDDNIDEEDNNDEVEVELQAFMSISR